MVDFKKRLNPDSGPWWARITKPVKVKTEEPETQQFSEEEFERAEEEYERSGNLDDKNIDAVADLIVARITEITSIAKENSIMPRGVAAQTRNGLPFLKTDNLSQTPEPFTILWAGTHEDAGMKNKFEAELLIKVQKDNGGAKFLLSLGKESPVLEFLDNSLGNDETTWANKKILLFNEIHPVNEQKFMRCNLPPAPTQTTSSAG